MVQTDGSTRRPAGGWACSMLKHRYDQRLAGAPARTAGNLPRGHLAEYDGLVRLYLGHGKVGSVFVPQQIFVNLGGWRFYQPSFFGPPHIAFLGQGVGKARFNIDVSGPYGDRATRLILDVSSEGRAHSWPDGSQLYHCRMVGPRNLIRFAAGRVVLLDGREHGLCLFHITNPDAALAIGNSGEIRASAWNLQGTRRLANIAYAYLTSMPAIRTESDLRRIAMSSDGQIAFQTTSFGDRETVLNLRVYRERTSGRTSAVSTVVPASLLNPPNLLLHPPVQGDAYYEIIGPEIFRVGLAPGASLRLSGPGTLASTDQPRTFTHVILGDPSGVKGLAAPYDEGGIDDVMHLEGLDPDDDPFSFWQRNANSDLMSGRLFEKRVFAPDPPTFTG